MTATANADSPVLAALPGIGYRSLLQMIHRTRRPDFYLEIGIGRGASLACSTCSSVAVDPGFRLATDVVSNKPDCAFYRQTSDEFFARPDVTRILSRPIDFAFLDGLHWFEVLLRDFINTEQYCSPDGLIALHDCLPYSAEIAERVHRPEARQDQRHRLHWAGDVWKVVPILRKHRPDLRIVSFDCPPTGLVVCTNLNPADRSLRGSYDRIVQEYSPIRLEDFTIEGLFSLSNMRPSRGLRTGERLAEALA